MKKSAVVLSFAALLLFVALFFYLRDTTGPEFTLSPGSGPVSEHRLFNLEMQDKGSGLRSVRVTYAQGEKSGELLNKSFDAGTIAKHEEFNLAGKGLSDGPLELRITAVDRSIFPFGSGNTTERILTYEFDGRAPVISLVTSTHNINQGGTALILYRLNEDPVRTGVVVGEHFFPGHRLQDDLFACLFAFPWSMKASDFTPRLVAEDAAGNERLSGFSFHANARTFPRDRINIGDNFLQTKMPEFETIVPGNLTPLERFLKVNGEVREQNVRSLEEIGRQTASKPLWDGVFERQAGATRGLFAQGRTYYYNGQEIDRATHLGIDIAGLAQMPVIASNRGTVTFADYLGIYGNCIIVDHGLGLQSLYAHLSQMNVKPGDSVTKGQVIGRSGTTGMAGGDHLHFGILVGGLEVAPLEWWDPNWMRNNITSKFNEVSGSADR